MTDAVPLVRPSDAPWAMQLAARVERLDPPTTAEVCAAAALAVVALLEDERSASGGPWADALETWQRSGRIRKLVRRGRASAWTRAQEPEGCTSRVGRAEVRAFVPSPMDEVPSEVAKLQIQSTDLDQPESSETIPADAEGMLIVVTPAVEMSWGKTAAQCAHAAQLLHRRSDRARLQRWVNLGRPVCVVHAARSLWESEVERSTVQVTDGGFTEIPAGTMTTVARWCA